MRRYECTCLGAPVLIDGAYNSSILATATPSRATMYYNYGPAPQAVKERVRKLKSCCEHHAVSVASADFLLAHSQVTNVIPGLGCATHTEQTINVYAVRIPRDSWTDYGPN